MKGAGLCFAAAIMFALMRGRELKSKKEVLPCANASRSPSYEGGS